MLRKEDPEKGGAMESPRPKRFLCENMSQLFWKGTKRGAGAVIVGWGFYLVFLVLSTHPCWQSSDCWTALFTGSQKETTASQKENNLVESVKLRKKSNFSTSNATGIEHIVFGIAASADKWNQRKQYVDLWWQPKKTRGYAWLDRPAPEPWPSESPPFRISADTSRFKFKHPNGARSAIRISRIVTETFRLGLPDVRWFVMCDDDTLFFTDNLLKVLSKYDHNQYYYIGSNSECVEQNAMHSYGMAYGGGGIAISYPLAEALSKTQDDCLDRYSDLYGSDQRVHACLAELGVPRTKEPGFHQMDVHGSVFGLLASHPLTPLVSLHHLDAVAPVFPTMTRTAALRHLMDAVKMDPDRAVQQSICYEKGRKWTVSVSWGYCVQLFGRVRLPRILEYPLETFVTWKSWARYPFVFNTRAVAKDPCDNPSILYMENVENSESGQIISSYGRGGAGIGVTRCNSTVNNPDTIKRVRIVSHKMRADWTAAPRRQCCEVVSSNNSVMEINIRSCRDGESMTPP